MARELKVTIVGDASSLHRAFGQAGQESESFGHKLGGAAKDGLLAVGAGAVVAGAALYEFGKKAMDEETIHARMVTQLKASGISFDRYGRQIDETITKQEQLSGFTRDELQASFTGLARTTGDANTALDDMALAANVARGKGIDLAAASALVTKAELGKVGALTRSGIEAKAVTTATDALKASRVHATQAMIDHAKALDEVATKHELIATLEQKFSGQAEAYGQTTAGSMDRFKNATHDLEVSLGTALLPTITKVTSGLATGVAWLQRSETAHKVVAAAAHGLGVAFHVIGEAIEYVRAHWEQISAVLDQVAAKISEAFNTIVAVVQGAITIITALWDAFGSTILSYVEATFENLKQIFTGAFNVIEGFFRLFGDIIHGRWADVWKDLEQIVTGAWQIVEGIFRQALNTLEAAAKLIGIAVVKGIEFGLSALTSLVRGILNAALNAVEGLAGAALNAAETVGKAVLQGIEFFVITLPKLMVTSVAKGLSGILGLAGTALRYAEKIGEDIVTGILSGVGGLYDSLKSKLESTLHSVLSSLNPFSPVEHGGEIFIGRPLAEGALQGWVDAAQELTPTMNVTLRQAAMSVDTSAFQGGSGGGVATSGGSSPVAIHLHLDGATIIGTDKRAVANDLAREITLALRDYQRQGGPSPVA